MSNTKKMASKNSSQKDTKSEDNNHFSNYALVYFDLETTGLGNSAEISQIGAHFAENDFSRYVCPKGEFDSGAAAATGFSKKGGVLYLHGKQVETVPILSAWTDFLAFLNCANQSVVLVIHNRPFDSRFVLRDLSTLNLMEKFRKLCSGMVDTLPLCREVFPERKKAGKSYRLEELVRDMIGEQHSAGSHNAIVDVRNLEKLMRHASVKTEVLKKHYLPLSNIEYTHNLRRKANFLKYKIPNLTIDMAKKIAEAEITYDDLKRIHSEDGEDGIKSLLSGERDGTPKVTNRKAVVKDITEALSGLKISS